MSNSGVDLNTYIANTTADASILGLLLFLTTKGGPAVLEKGRETVHEMLSQLYADEKTPDSVKEQIRKRVNTIVDIALKQCK